MSYLINKNNQKIAYKIYHGKSPGIIFIHGLNSDMNGIKAQNIKKYAIKNKLSFIRFDCRGHGKSFGKFEDFTGLPLNPFSDRVMICGSMEMLKSHKDICNKAELKEGANSNPSHFVIEKAFVE